jgi:predicted Zn-dependent protease with MMP-like domain
MTDDEFEQLVVEGIDAIPERFMKRLDNVAIITALHPTAAQLRANDIPEGDTLLGLYEGIPLTARGDAYGAGIVLPDTITIFKEPIMEEAEGDSERARTIVRETVWHEVAHYFGHDDPSIEAREDEGTNYSR